MKRYRIYLNAIAGMLMIILMGSAVQAWAYENKVNDGGGVRVTAKPEALAADGPVKFEISLNTHSVELGQDLTAVSELRDDQGRRYHPEKWEGSPPGGHHRRGILFFPTLQTPVRSITLIIRGIADVKERSFTWQVEP